MKPAILLDSGPLGLLCQTRRTALPIACQDWLEDLTRVGRRVIVPEITDYEVRRELLRIGSTKGIAKLDSLALTIEYLPLTTSVMRLAADLWAQMRQAGRPTAGDRAIDADVILAAQAIGLGIADIVIATTTSVTCRDSFRPNCGRLFPRKFEFACVPCN